VLRHEVQVPLPVNDLVDAGLQVDSRQERRNQHANDIEPNPLLREQHDSGFAELEQHQSGSGWALYCACALPEL